MSPARRVDPHCGYTPANCPYGDACADCEPADEAAQEARVDHMAARLRLEMSAWISSHPNAGLFDWHVLAREVLRVADTPARSRERAS